MFEATDGPARWWVMFAWVAGAWLACCGLAAYPTWYAEGAAGLRAGMASAGVAFVVMVASGLAVARFARRGAASAAVAFSVAAVVRLVACAALSAVIVAVWKLPLKTYLAWLVPSYLVMLAGECTWLVRVLRRDGL